MIKRGYPKRLCNAVLTTSLLYAIAYSQESEKPKKTLPAVPIKDEVIFSNKSADYYGFKKETSIHDAVAQFNEKYSQAAQQFEQAPLTEDEVMAALAIAQLHRPGNDAEFANACVDYAQRRILPLGAKFVLLKSADIGSPGHELEYRFWYVYISFNNYPAESGDWSYIEVPTPAHAATMYEIPVRLVHRAKK